MEFYTFLLFHQFSLNRDLNDEIEVIYTDQRKRQKSFLRYRNCKETGITLPNYSFRILLESFKPKELIILIQLLLLERKLILIQSDPNQFAIVIESLLLLLAPL